MLLKVPLDNFFVSIGPVFLLLLNQRLVGTMSRKL